MGAGLQPPLRRQVARSCPVDRIKVNDIFFPVIIALHRRGELDLETLNEASKACAEAWSICGSWRGLDNGKTAIGSMSTRLRENVLDEDGVSYKGEPVYVP